MGNCTGWMGRMMGHKFRPIITQDAARDLPVGNGPASMLLDLTDKLRNETYHGLYCPRCGILIKDTHNAKGDAIE